MENYAAIVTGGTQGIGKSITLQFARNGIEVFALDKDKQAGEELIKEHSDLPVQFIEADISVLDNINRAVTSIQAKNSTIRYLINNAGVSIFENIDTISVDDWDTIIKTNLTAPFVFSKLNADLLGKNKGRIVNIASTRAIMSEPDNEAYASSKGGLLALTHALANSLGPDVLVNCISPGWIDVSLWKKSANRKQIELSEQDHSQHPSGRVGKPEDIAEMAYFLCVEQGGFITGQNFVVDGGMSKKMIYT